MVRKFNSSVRAVVASGFTVLAIAYTSFDGNIVRSAEAASDSSASTEIYSSTLAATASPVERRRISAAIAAVKMFSDKNQPETALKEAENQLKRFPDNADLRLIAGVLYNQLGKTEQAEEIFIQLSKEYPSLPEPLNNLAVIYVNRGDLNRAISTLQKAFETHPSYARVQSNLRTLYTTLASQAYNKALNIGNEAPVPVLASLDQIATATGHTAAPINLNAGSSTTVASVNETTLQTPEIKAAKLAEVKPTVVKQEPKPKPKPEPKVEAKVKVKQEQPKVVAKTEPKPLPKPKESKAEKLAPEKVIHTRLLEWATSWSSQDPERYITFYTNDYKPDIKTSHNKWVAQRKVRLKRPSFIKVRISIPKTHMLSAIRAETRFIQNYRADHFEDRVEKSIIWALENNEWKILKEQTVKKLK